MTPEFFALMGIGFFAQLADLADEPFIWIPRRAAPYYDRVIDHCRDKGLRLDVVQEAMDGSALLSLVAVGMGVSFVPESARPRCSDDVALVSVPDFTFELTLEFVWRSTALALPNGDGGAAFPYRDLIIFTAFCVVFGTLVLQGLTLRPLLTRLDLRDDDPVGREVDHARTVAYGAAIAALDGNSSALAKAIRVELQSSLTQSYGETPLQDRASSSAGVRLLAVEAARRALLAMRASGEIGDDAFHRVEEEIDRLELSAT